jgi:predicted transcriptional regulator
MELAKEIMTTPVRYVTENTKLNIAAQMMKEDNVGFLVVGDGASPSGCLTDRDIVVEGVARGFDPKQHRVSEVMTRNPLICDANTKLSKVTKLMQDHKVYRIIVADRTKTPLGVISFGDLASRANEDISLEQALRSISQHPKGR